LLLALNPAAIEPESGALWEFPLLLELPEQALSNMAKDRAKN
jgi:hypothetical protein